LFLLDIDNHAICIQRQSYFSFPNLYTFYFLFFSYFISKDFYYDVKKQWGEGKFLSCSWSYLDIIQFFTTELCYIFCTDTVHQAEEVLSTLNLLKLFSLFLVMNECWNLSNAFSASIDRLTFL
jgi:hypothetical protein